MENNERKLLRLRDVFIIVSVIAAAFVFYALLPEGGGKAAVLFNGEVIAEIPLDGSEEYVFPQVPDMVFTAENGAVSVTESNCGDKVCVRTGKISRQGEAIICVPNKIIVEIKGNTKESDVDAVL